MSSDEPMTASRSSQPPADEVEPQRVLTKAEVEEQLRRRRASIDGHIDGLEQELKASSAQVQQGAEGFILQNMAPVLGGLALAGAAVGYWFVRRGQKRRAAAEARSWADEYREAVRKEVRQAAQRGEDPGEAAGRILEGHQPLVVRERSASGSDNGMLRTTMDLIGRTLITVAVKYAVDATSEHFLPPSETQEVEQASEDAAPVASVASSEE